MLQTQSCTKSVCLDIIAQISGLYQIGELTTEQMSAISQEIKRAMAENNFGNLIRLLSEIEESKEQNPTFSQTFDQILKEVYKL